MYRSFNYFSARNVAPKRCNNAEKKRKGLRFSEKCYQDDGKLFEKTVEFASRKFRYSKKFISTNSINETVKLSYRIVFINVSPPSTAIRYSVAESFLTRTDISLMRIHGRVGLLFLRFSLQIYGNVVPTKSSFDYTRDQRTLFLHCSRYRSRDEVTLAPCTKG